MRNHLSKCNRLYRYNRSRPAQKIRQNHLCNFRVQAYSRLWVDYNQNLSLHRLHSLGGNTIIITITFIIIIIIIITPWSRVLLEKLTGCQVVKKYPALYVTRRFITASISARNLSLSLARSIQSMSPHTISWRPSSILFSHLCLGLQSDLLPYQNPVYTSLPTTCFIIIIIIIIIIDLLE
jgi:hypothetical protein